jgi:hypothetical protein
MHLQGRVHELASSDSGPLLETHGLRVATVGGLAGKAYALGVRCGCAVVQMGQRVRTREIRA